MKQSKYLEVFKKADRSGYKLKGNLILVENVTENEKKKQIGDKTIYLSVDDGKKQINGMGAEIPIFCIVLETGEGYTDENGDVIPNSLDVKVGDIILIPRVSVKFFSMIPDFSEYESDTIGLAKESEIQMVFDSAEGYQKYFNSLNNKSE